eukprot:1314188-Pyramimonas_sp.AAC.1
MSRASGARCARAPSALAAGSPHGGPPPAHHVARGCHVVCLGPSDHSENFQEGDPPSARARATISKIFKKVTHRVPRPSRPPRAPDTRGFFTIRKFPRR